MGSCVLYGAVLLLFFFSFLCHSCSYSSGLWMDAGPRSQALCSPMESDSDNNPLATAPMRQACSTMPSVKDLHHIPTLYVCGFHFHIWKWFPFPYIQTIYLTMLPSHYDAVSPYLFPPISHVPLLLPPLVLPCALWAHAENHKWLLDPKHFQ